VRQRVEGLISVISTPLGSGSEEPIKLHCISHAVVSIDIMEILEHNYLLAITIDSRSRSHAKIQEQFAEVIMLT
jgi:hypothetical protein